MGDETARCPKCRTPPPANVGGDAACARCGLLVARWASFAEARGDDGLDETWGELRRQWADPKAHARAIERAVAQGALPSLVARYRGVLDEHPDDAAARGGIERAAARAMTAVESSSTPVTTARAAFALRAAAVVLAVALAALAAWGGARLLASRRELPPKGARP